MFRSKISVNKREIRTAVRKIFSSNEKKDVSSKQSFSRKLKTRLSKYWKKNQSHDEHSNEDHFSLSSILKGRRSKSTLFKRKLSFVEEIEDEDCVAELKIPTESDIAYYKKMKEELLERNKDIEIKNKLKRKASNADNKNDNPKKKPNLSAIEESWTKDAQESVATLVRCPLFYGSFENVYSSMSSIDTIPDLNTNDGFEPKMLQSKKSRHNRYNPMSKSNLSFSNKKSNEMSWCS